MSEDDFYERIGTQHQGQAAQAQAQHTLVAMMPGEAPTSDASAGVTPAPATIVRRWNQADDIFWPAAETIETLKPGFYKFDAIPNIGVCLRRMKINIDGLMRLPDTGTADVLAEFQHFWTLRERFTSRGFLHKRGYLLWGPAGSGKTSGLMQMAADIIDSYGGIVCQIEDPVLAAHGLGLIRKIEPDRPIVALIEDLDALVRRGNFENAFLALLDGEAQVDRITYIATTNYPELLDRRFVDRPSRFDTIRYIGMPSAAARSVYLATKEPSLTEAELAEWVGQTEGFSVAHLRELVILVKCFEQPLSVAIKRLEKMRAKKPSSDDSPDSSPFGFGAR